MKDINVGIVEDIDQKRGERMSEKLNFSLEVSPSSRATCTKVGCCQKIQKDTLRMRSFVGVFHGHARYEFYCTDCAIKILSEYIDVYDEMLRQLIRSQRK